MFDDHANTDQHVEVVGLSRMYSKDKSLDAHFFGTAEESTHGRSAGVSACRACVGN